MVAGASRWRRVTPIDARDRVARKLLLAGSPSGWDAERVLAFKIIGLGGGIVLGFFVTTLIGGLAPFIRIVVIGLLAFVGFMAPDSVLNRRVEERQKEILRTLSDTLDLLTISVEAGLAERGDRAGGAERARRAVLGVRADAAGDPAGRPAGDAFRNLAERTDVEELNAFALAMIQADVFGVSIASVLRTQAQQLRIKRRQAAEAKAQQTPVKIVFPLILCILPALFVVIVGPGAIQIWESFIQTEVGPARRARAATLPRDEGRLPGEPGAYSERAVRSLFADAEPLPCATVRHAFSRVTSGEAAFGVVPLENSQAGSVNETYELLSNTSLLRIVGESIVRVDHALLGLPGARVWKTCAGRTPLAGAGAVRGLPRVDADRAGPRARHRRRRAQGRRGRRPADGAIASVDAATVSGLIVLAERSRPRRRTSRSSRSSAGPIGARPRRQDVDGDGRARRAGVAARRPAPFAARGSTCTSSSRGPGTGRVRVPDVRRLHGAGRRPRGGGRAQGGAGAHLDAEDPGFLPPRANPSDA